MDNSTWEQANRMDALQVRALIVDDEPDGRTDCPFCGTHSSLHAYDHGGFHCFGECGGPSGQTYTNTEVVAKVREVPIREARTLICGLA